MFRNLGLPKALTRKFFSGVMSPKFRSYGGWKCQLCSSAPQNPLVKFSPSTVWWVRGTPSTSQWKFQVRASSRFRAIDVDRLIRMACMWRSILPIQRSLMTLLHTLRGRSRCVITYMVNSPEVLAVLYMQLYRDETIVICMQDRKCRQMFLQK